MPGLNLSPEMDYDGPPGGEGGGGGGGGGSRFQRMMNQAKINEQQRAAGIAPGASPRSREDRPAAMSREQKEKAVKEAVERQQKLMAKSRGIDLDDPTLSGAELAKKKALSRAQAEAK